MQGEEDVDADLLHSVFQLVEDAKASVMASFLLQ